jgi:hypothetical protein
VQLGDVEMRVLEFPLNEERVQKAVHMLNTLGPEVVSQAAFKIIEEWIQNIDPPPKRILYLVTPNNKTES